MTPQTGLNSTAFVASVVDCAGAVYHQCLSVVFPHWRANDGAAFLATPLIESASHHWQELRAELQTLSPPGARMPFGDLIPIALSDPDHPLQPGGGAPPSAPRAKTQASLSAALAAAKFARTMPHTTQPTATSRTATPPSLRPTKPVSGAQVVLGRQPSWKPCTTAGQRN